MQRSVDLVEFSPKGQIYYTAPPINAQGIFLKRVDGKIIRAGGLGSLL